jgi:hypothetical protein
MMGIKKKMKQERRTWNFVGMIVTLSKGEKI